MVANKAVFARSEGYFRLNSPDTVNQRDSALNGPQPVGAASGGSRHMQFQVIKAGAARQKTACAVVGVYEGAALGDAGRKVDRASGGAISLSW